MKMNLEKAVKLAVMALKEQIKIIAFDANAYDVRKIDYPYAIKCSKKRSEYLEAIKILEEEANRKVDYGSNKI